MFSKISLDDPLTIQNNIYMNLQIYYKSSETLPLHTARTTKQLTKENCCFWIKAAFVTYLL